MPKLYVEPLGCLGNVLIQYMAAKILQKIKNYEITLNKDDLKKYIVYNDYYWFNQILPHNDDNDILMYGFFQNCIPYIQFKDYLKSVINKNNNDIITAQFGKKFKISNLFTYNNHTYENEIVIHIRLSDNESIIHPQHYLDILDNYKNFKLTIVTDRIQYDYEHEYISYFSKYKPIIHNKSIIEDFNYLRNAKIVILSNSTFAYLAGFFGCNEKVYILYNNTPNQILHTTGNDNCTSIEVKNYFVHVKDMSKFTNDYYKLRDNDYFTCSD